MSITIISKSFSILMLVGALSAMGCSRSSVENLRTKSDPTNPDLQSVGSNLTSKARTKRPRRAPTPPDTPQPTPSPSPVTPSAKFNGLFVTWINVWHGSSEPWWTPNVSPIRLLTNGSFAVADSSDPLYRQSIMSSLKNAGVGAVIMDLTNGTGGWVSQSLDYQRLAQANGMQFATAIQADASNIDSEAEIIWSNYVAPRNQNANVYLQKNGKPVLVIYAVRDDFNAAVAATGTYRDKFELVWASGEDSNINKWGWQLEPWIGPQPSSDSMFVTSSVKCNAQEDSWRKSLSMLDFSFLAAAASNPAYIIVGMIDDTSERNGWAIEDTTNAVAGLQMRDINGVISIDGYYNRVKAWRAGTASAYNPGGIIKDGAYTISNNATGKGFGIALPTAQVADDLAAPLHSGQNLDTNMNTYYWFYHLGNNAYRIIKLSNGLSLSASKSNQLVLNWDANDPAQRWTLTKLSNNHFVMTNQATGTVLFDSSSTASPNQAITVVAKSSSDPHQEWMLVPVADRVMN